MTNFVIPKKDRVPWSSDTRKHSAAFKLFHYPFRFRISKLHITDLNALQQFGHVTTGNPETDRILASEEVLIQRTIADMTEFHRHGNGFRLYDPRDGVKIYEIIYQHLRDWRHELESNHLKRQAPIDDLRALDEFAKDVYRLARGYISYQPAEGTLSNFFEQLAASRGSLGRREGQLSIQDEYRKLHTSEHQEQAGAMSKILRERQRSFRN